MEQDSPKGGFGGLINALQSIALAILSGQITFQKNQYKFYAYRNAALNTVNGVFTKVVFDTEVYDDNANYDPSTGRYTCPIDGVYQFTAHMGFGGSGRNIFAFYKNGAYWRPVLDIGGTAYNIGGSIEEKMVAGDYVEVYYYIAATVAVNLGGETNFSGHFETK